MEERGIPSRRRRPETETRKQETLMRKHRFRPLLVLALLLPLATAAGMDGRTPAGPPFDLQEFAPASTGTPAPGGGTVYGPLHPYNIFINYELGMHCVGFDVSYCCIIPPYNSIQAQVVRSGAAGEKPRLLSPDDGVRLSYFVEDNRYSEGNKMKYWGVPKDTDGNGSAGDPGDSIANYVWTHLFLYRDPAGTLPDNPDPSLRLRIGRELPVNVDSGPSGKNLFGGYLDYAGERGGNIVFTDSLVPQVRNVPLTLTASHLWDALGLPLTAFNDSTRRGSIRTVTDEDFQPYQRAVVQLRDEKGGSVAAGGKTVEFFGTEPIDIADCSLCHSGGGKAAELSRRSGLSLFEKEYAYWKENYADVSEYVARLSSATINVLELHDRHSGTAFLREYDPAAPSNRLGAVGPVYCADCHGDNISGNLQSPRPGATGYKTVRARPLTEAVHSVHALVVPMPDKAGRSQNCQVCHPMHWQSRDMNRFETNPHAVADGNGNPRFSDEDLRTAGGGCYLRRDAHANPAVSPPFFLNAVGRWYLENVSMTDETRRPVRGLRGLYCTNCHNHLSRELYRHDDLQDAVTQKGKTLRNRPIRDVIAAVAGGDEKRFGSFFADPTTDAPGNPLHAYHAQNAGAPLARAVKGDGPGLRLLPWNAGKGMPVLYPEVSAGSDWWLAAGEPHCSDCHLAPFVESEGGKYFPIDQPGKYALYRFSKAHGALACQSCHESMHGLYPVRYEGPAATVDRTSHEQALQYSPDGGYAGPVTCVACHTVNRPGVPVQLAGTKYADDYWAAVVLIHFMREGDQKLPVSELVGKYPFARSRAVVLEGKEETPFLQKKR